MVNKVTLVGRVGKDPEYKVTAGGTPMCRISLATSEKRKDKSGETVEQTEWHRLTAWGRTAEVVRDYVHKGDLLYIDGRIHYDSYENKEGQKVYTTDIMVNGLQMLGGKVGSAGDSHQPESGSGSAPQPAQSPTPAAGGFGDDDLPF